MNETDAMDSNMDKYSLLKHTFGFECFREGQEELIDCLMDDRDVAGIMPTGAGKSICFYVPAMMKEGTTLVISPLISLMKDQVQALKEFGIPAAYLNSSLTPGQFQKALDNAARGDYRILYVSPERLGSPGFIRMIHRMDLAAVIVDEAHCVSQWGQDFRPSYGRIREFVAELQPRPPVGAFTATATPQVQEDILHLLGLKDPVVVKTGFDRKNLHFEVQKPKDKKRVLKKLLREFEGKSGIVYCSTRKAVEEVYGILAREGLDVTMYHAGLEDEERQNNQEDFRCDRKPVVVATNALGMGIDKSNVSFVIHYNMPMNLESYYQEAGRAGRDGTSARCILLYGGQDVRTNQYLIENGSDRENLDPATRQRITEKDRERLKLMSFYCHTADCLRGYILRYFGENASPFCGSCGNCDLGFESQDITVEAQKILSCVARLNQSYGVKMVTDVLRGSRQKRILELGLDRLPTYGIMEEEKEQWIREILGHLTQEGILHSTADQYPVLQLAESAASVLQGVRTVSMPVRIRRKEERNQDTDTDGQTELELIRQLKNLRKEIAKDQGIPAYIVFSDATLRDMGRKRPRDRDELLEVSGVGEAKMEKYGELFLAVLGAYRT